MIYLYSNSGSIDPVNAISVTNRVSNVILNQTASLIAGFNEKERTLKPLEEVSHHSGLPILLIKLTRSVDMGLGIVLKLYNYAY